MTAAIFVLAGQYISHDSMGDIGAKRACSIYTFKRSLKFYTNRTHPITTFWVSLEVGYFEY